MRRIALDNHCEKTHYVRMSRYTPHHGGTRLKSFRHFCNRAADTYGETLRVHQPTDTSILPIEVHG